ncbi:septation ring formation regulator EzrA [Bacillus cereus]|uniref:septation ring formation regulator EzrA n=1 Tax=Bacillus cereus TaxID=1396 RepID=UPI000BF72D33|nr:septation ring formation regulator EzrA [Bacillus cereus]PEW70505.1 septation ring formation regulator EzrA [Bacillus cereus]
MNEENLLQKLNDLQYSEEFIDEYTSDEIIDKKKIERTKKSVTKNILMNHCHEVVQKELQMSEEILYSMVAANPRVKSWQTGTAMTLGIGALAMNFGINNVLVFTNERLYVFFVDRYYNEVDLKIYSLTEIVYMKTVLDRKDGSEFLYIKYKNGKEYVLLGNSDEYRDVFSIISGLKIASGIRLSLHDKKLKWMLTMKRITFYVIMYSIVTYLMYRVYVNFMLGL